MTDTIDYTAPFAAYGQVETAPRSRLQKIVASTMRANASAIPHVTHHDEVDVTELEGARKAMSPDLRVSPLIFIIKAVVGALKIHPQFNASLSPDGEVLVLKKYFNVGIAVDTPAGLLVPVLRDCESKDMATLRSELKEVTALARSKGLPLHRMTGGCFTISSLGGIGGTQFTPIINGPEVAILGVTGIQHKPVWRGQGFEPRLMLPLSLSYDHRVINGADAARFVRQLGAGLTELAKS